MVVVLLLLVLRGARSSRPFACVCAAGDGQTSLDRAQCPTTAVGVGTEQRLPQGGGGGGKVYPLNWAGDRSRVRFLL